MKLKKNIISMSKIKKIYAYEIIDSRGYPTIEGRLVLDNGQSVVSSVPAGTSIGKYEALELRDNDKTKWDGMGVSQAVSYVNDLIGPKLQNVSPLKLQEVDNWLIKADATKNKNNLGANVTLLISELFVKAGALDTGLSIFKYVNQLYEQIYKNKIKVEKIPTPIFNVINGGKHGNNNLDFQEFQIIPSSSFSFSKAYEIGVEVFHELRRMLEYRNAIVSVGEEGGFTPNFVTNIDAIEIIVETLNQRKLQVGVDVFTGLDIAASHFFQDNLYHVKDKAHPLKVDEYLELVQNLVKKYSVMILEDPLNQDDWEYWHKLNELLSREIYLVGDDLLVTNKERLQRAIKEKSCTTILIKPNQIGTISETLEVINIARNNNFNYIVSHRSGETNDSFIADFAVGVQSEFVKFGAPCRGERVAKYNRLWQIEREELK